MMGGIVPIERKARIGRTPTTTAGGRPLVGPPAPTTREVGQTAPPVPSGITGRGRLEWDRIWEAGYWLREDQDYHWVEMIARAYQQIEAFRDQVNHDGNVVTGYAKQKTAHPLIKEIRDAERVVMTCLSSIGFSPRDRARLNLVKAQTHNALADLIQRGRQN